MTLSKKYRPHGAMKITFFFLLAGLLNPGGIPWAGTCKKSPSPAMSMAMAKASQAMEADQQERAIELLTRAIRRAGKQGHHLLEFHIGVALTQANQQEKALPHFRKATTLCETYAPAWQNRGRVAYELESYGEAAQALGEAFLLTGESRANLRYFQALAQFKNKQWGDTITLCLDLMTRFPGEIKPEWAELTAAAATPAKKRPDVIRALSDYIPTLGGSPRFRRVLANLLLQENRHAEALVQLQNLDHLGTLATDECTVLGDLYRMERLPLDAAACYRRSAKTGAPSALLAQKEAEALMAGLQPTQARKVLEQGIKRWDTPRLWLLTGQLRFEDQNFSGAEAAFRRVLSHRPTHPHALMMLGYSLFQQNKTGDALVCLDKAVKMSPKGPAKALRDYVAGQLEAS